MRLRIAALAALAVLVADAVTAEPAASVPGRDAAATVVRLPAPGDGGLVIGLIEAWLVSNYPLSPGGPAPSLAVAPADILARLRYGPQAAGMADVMAVYLKDEATIYLRDDWDGAEPADLSVLVHEMVHHLQDAAGQRHACPGEREALAYRAQQDWLALFGQDLAGAFGIDRLTLMLRTTCAY